MYSDEDIERLARVLAQARADRAPVELPPGMAMPDRAEAYRIQTRVNQLVMPPGAVIAGFKVSGMQAVSGSNTSPGLVIKVPLTAPLWSHRVFASGVVLDGGPYRTLGLETEICLRLGVHTRGGGKAYEIVGAMPAFEIVEHRQVGAINDDNINLLIADSVANAGVVLGDEVSGYPDDILDGIASLSRNGQLVMERRIGDRLKDPRRALDVLKAALDPMGWTPPDGAILLTGLLTTELWLEPGDEGVGVIGPLGRVTASLRKG